MKKSLVLLGLVSACQSGTLVVTQQDGGPPVSNDAAPPGTGDDASTASDAAPPVGPMPVGLAVINSDYVSSSLSLVDPTSGTVTKSDCLHSGSVEPLLSLALSGDVGLPSQPLPGNELVLIDHKNATLTWVDLKGADPAKCAPLAQLAIGTGFDANPQDAIGVSEQKLYVTRHQWNPMPMGSLDQGDDILIVDRTAMKITGRIDLHAYASTVNGVAMSAHPARGLLIDGKVYVTLVNANADFSVSGTGKLAVIDASTDTVTTTLDFSPYKNCFSLDYAPASKTLYVACNGDYNNPNHVAESSIVTVDLGGAAPQVGKLVIPTQVSDHPLSNFSVSVTNNQVFSVAFGDYGGPLFDTLWSYDLSTKTSTKVLTADNGFVLGRTAIDLVRGQIYITDASLTKPLVHVFQITSGMPQELKGFASSGRGLAPREMGWY